MQELLVDQPVAESRPAPERAARRRADLLGLGVVAFAAQLPVLKTHLFYYYDDTSSVIIPGWRLIGEQLLQGRLPLLDVDTWLGGNFAGEAQFGLFNPLTMANAVLVALLPDLAVAAILIKTEFLVLLAAGVYLLAREYGAGRNAAAVAAIALPFSGYTLFWDAQAWITNLIAFTLTTHTWWTLRRYARGRLHPVVPLVVAGLTTTSGSPYSVLGVVVVVAAVIIERLVNRQLRAAVGVAVIGLAAGLMAAVVFLPLLGMQPVGTRQAGGVFNTGQLVPSLGHLLNLSAPTYVPRLYTFGPATTPITYLAWFVVPLLPWFAWSALRDGRARAGIFAVGLAYLALTLAPSNLWMFRWPARLIEYLFLAVILAVALLLSAGLRTDHAVRRGLGSAGLILLSTYLVWADRPDQARRAAEAALVVGVLVLAVVLAARHRARLVTPALVAGTLMMLVLQLNWFPRNRDITPWQFPHDVAQLRADFADRSDGNTLIVANSFSKIPNADKQPDRAWREVLFGNVSHVAGMDALNAYTGMGNRQFGAALCMEYEGSVCDEAYQRVFATDPATGVPLADLLRLRTVTLLNAQVPGTLKPTPELLRDQPYAFDLRQAPPGWQTADRGTYATVIRRTAELPHPDGRVSWTAPGLTVTADQAGPSTEEIRYRGGGRVIVAALAWPGWHASVDGHYLPVDRGPAGLIQVDLPERAEGTLKLWFVPAGLRTGVELLAVGVLIGAGYCTYHTVRVRRRRVHEPA
ncbi:hypothetical protein PQF33_01900 [Dactylosporangium aurantiacum]|uniref:hypothetical protein n=1 Tax=Dactylosporangium aurantiacum TaxID=35754 RepID=UPI002434DB82|nr:hypothetical protein [Dactylosporangium aurantiacum]MDG6100853.1 hypothetical protein [Dactylosporangium aurantiacum]